MTLKFFNVSVFHNLQSKSGNAITISCETEDPEQRVEIHRLTERDIFTIADNLCEFCYQRLGLRDKLYRTYYFIDKIVKVWVRESKNP
tara:strand:+ start:96 stop:359 length:264 start_codon:yes stop_codon:yes gene_type:complete